MTILVVGLNHKTAGVETRERLAFNGPRLEEGLKGLRELPGVGEAALLSTCNRVEMYLAVDKPAEASGTVKDFLARFHGLSRGDFENSLYVHQGPEAVRHVLRVASSLDSMVVGEPQILGQLKDTFEFALSKKTTGVLLNRLMKKAISTAKRVRTETRIAENAVSISFAAVELARKIFTDLAGKSFMLLGAGEMAELAARHLITNGVTDVCVANRTFERGCELASEFCGRAVRFEDYTTELVQTDILICSTGAPKFVLLKDQMQRVMKERRHKPVFIIDISVPRNIDPAVNDLDNVYLYNVDDLQQVVDTNVLERKKEAQKAEGIVGEETEKFQQWLGSLDSVPVVVALRQRAEDIRREEVERVRHKFQGLDSATLEGIEHLSHAITNKLMHGPTVALKEQGEDKAQLVDLIKKLYGIQEDDDN